MGEILDEIDSILAAGKTVFVHCWGGRGRTGTVVGCYLIRHGIAKEGETLAMLAELTQHQRTAFGHVPETADQRRFVTAWKAGQ